MASLQKLSSGKYRVSWHVTCKHGANQGQIYRGSMVFKDRRTASEFASRVGAEEEKWKSGLSAPSIRTLTTLGALVNDFLSAPMGLSDRTRGLYRAVFAKLGAVVKSQDISKVTEQVIRRFLDDLPSAPTRNNHLTALKSLFGFAHSREYIIRNPCERIGYAKIGDVQRIPPTRQQLAKLLKRVHKQFPHLRYRILLLAHTGLRLTEALSIRPENILHDRLIVLGKGNKRRQIPLDPIAKLCLRRMEWPVVGSNVALRHTWHESVNRLAKRIGMETLGPHQLRHWFLTQLAEAGVDMGRIARIAGHSTTAITYRVYVHYQDETPVRRGHRLHWRKWFGE